MKTDNTPETVEFGFEVDALEVGKGLNGFGFGANKIYYLGNADKYLADTDVDLKAEITRAQGVIAKNSLEDGEFLNVKLNRFIANGQAATTAKDKQNAYLSLKELNDYIDVVTGIESITTDGDTRKSAEGIYTISGVKMNKATKPGLYIINGKKVVIK